jgi:hypothetical protein
MTEDRSGKDRRVKKSRRTGGDSSYSGPENRATKDRRNDTERRKKEQK